MQVLVGPASIPMKLKNLVSHSIADGIADQDHGNCEGTLCTPEELAIA